MALGNLQEEPSAGKPHARICEGESRMAELLDRSLLPADSTIKIRDRQTVDHSEHDQLDEPPQRGGSSPFD